MLSKEENELLTRVGPGTPCGELLRRYWHPIAAASELTEDQPKKRVKVLGEELVLYRDADGGFGLLAEHCSHRGTSLYYGFLENGGLRCPYHGWLYDRNGTCLEQPFEPNPRFRESIRHTAYPVQKLAGLLFAYMGPEPAPLLPRWDILVWDRGQRRLERQETLNCNWLQAVENTMDFVHTSILHAYSFRKLGKSHMGARFLGRPFVRYGFQPFQWGLLKSWEYEGDKAGSGWGNPLVFPTMFRQSDIWSAMHWRVPVDDTQTEIYVVHFRPSEDGQPVAQPEEPPLELAPPQLLPGGEYALSTFYSQDKMAWETQGAIYDRGAERVGMSDRGIILYRKLLAEQIEVVRGGGEPVNTIRDPEKNHFIDLEGWCSERDVRAGARSQGKEIDQRRAREQVFDDRHEVFEVPYGTARPRPVK